MNRTLPLVATALLALAGCQAATDSRTVAPADPPAGAAPAASPAEGGAPPLTAEGWGPLRVGMTRAEVVAAAGEDANPEAVGGPEPEMCDEFRPARAPEGLLVMIERDTLTRISVGRESEVRTDRGIGLGDPAAAVREAYGPAASRLPHKYLDAPAEYLTVWTTPPPAPAPRGIVYEVGTDGRVFRIHAGGRSIQYVEGCL